ncbi:MAG: sigma-54 dependent transcriptional regulator [Peptostreptococcaceae bacterium]|nr:sigma-54 dependent transcriptional regulator [Peptostreptococcaceae bacterium]
MKVLVVDDEKGIRTSLKFFLKGEGFDIQTAETGEEGLEKFERCKPDVVILDINLPGIDGLDVLCEIKKKSRDTIVIMITYRSEVKLAVSAMKLGAYDYFMKPFAIADIKKSLLDSADYLSLKKSIEEKSVEGSFVGEHPTIADLKKKIQKLVDMKMDTTILISGSSGTGKEILGKYIHEVMTQGVKPFVAINCAAIPQSLQESEFFGYEKGAFTEAKARKVGLIEQANGGTLFLDEVADMDLELQAKMLRVLQEKRFRRVGGLEEIEFSTTVITATNKDLRKEIREGRFREDLFYRLNVVPLKLPDLSERRSDIPLLVDYFIKEYNRKLKKEVEGIDPDAMLVLKGYPWNGNIRELKNMVERVMIFQEDRTITKKDLPEELMLDESADFFGGRPIDHERLDQAQADIIKKALEENDWNITRTAEKLGISRLTLRKKIQKYELEK